MDKTTIGVNAGIVWRTIDSSGRAWKYEELKKETKLSDRDLNAAIGWLARENKIEFDSEMPDGEEVMHAPVLRQIARYLPHHRSENASKTHPKSSHDKFKTVSKNLRRINDDSSEIFYVQRYRLLLFLLDIRFFQPVMFAAVFLFQYAGNDDCA